MAKPKILFLDIETAPAKVYTFSLFKPFIGNDQIIEPSRILCWSAQWYGSKKVLFRSEYHDGQEVMMQEIRDLLDEADAVVGYNSKRFDVPWLKGEITLAGLEQPSPFQHVDLYQVARSNMRLLSGKLDYLAWRLLNERKVTHTGFQLWIDCMDGDDETKAKAWRLMKKYSVKDTALMPPIYDILRPVIKSIPNHGLWDVPLVEDNREYNYTCPRCGATKVQSRGFSRTTAGVFRRFHCQECGGWSKTPQRLATTDLRPL